MDQESEKAPEEKPIKSVVKAVIRRSTRARRSTIKPDVSGKQKTKYLRIPKWPLEEKQQLLPALQQRTSMRQFDYSNLSRAVKGRKKGEVEDCVTALRARAKSNKIEAVKKQAPIKIWNTLFEDFGDNDADCAKLMSKTMTMAGLEETTVPTKLSMQDFQPHKVYNYLARLMRGSSLPKLSPLESQIILDCFENLLEKLKGSEIKEQAAFLRSQYFELYDKAYCDGQAFKKTNFKDMFIEGEGDAGCSQWQPSSSQSQPGSSRSQPGTSQSQPGTSQLQPDTSQSQPGTSQFAAGTSQVGGATGNGSTNSTEETSLTADCIDFNTLETMLLNPLCIPMELLDFKPHMGNPRNRRPRHSQMVEDEEDATDSSDDDDNDVDDDDDVVQENEDDIELNGSGDIADVTTGDKRRTEGTEPSESGGFSDVTNIEQENKSRKEASSLIEECEFVRRAIDQSQSALESETDLPDLTMYTGSTSDDVIVLNSQSNSSIEVVSQSQASIEEPDQSQSALESETELPDQTMYTDSISDDVIVLNSQSNSSIEVVSQSQASIKEPDQSQGLPPEALLTVPSPTVITVPPPLPSNDCLNGAPNSYNIVDLIQSPQNISVSSESEKYPPPISHAGPPQEVSVKSMGALGRLNALPGEITASNVPVATAPRGSSKRRPPLKPTVAQQLAQEKLKRANSPGPLPGQLFTAPLATNLTPMVNVLGGTIGGFGQQAGQLLTIDLSQLGPNSNIVIPASVLPGGIITIRSPEIPSLRTFAADQSYLGFPQDGQNTSSHIQTSLSDNSPLIAVQSQTGNLASSDTVASNIQMSQLSSNALTAFQSQTRNLESSNILSSSNQPSQLDSSAAQSGIRASCHTVESDVHISQSESSSSLALRRESNLPENSPSTVGWSETRQLSTVVSQNTQSASGIPASSDTVASNIHTSQSDINPSITVHSQTSDDTVTINVEMSQLSSSSLMAVQSQSDNRASCHTVEHNVHISQSESSSSRAIRRESNLPENSSSTVGLSETCQADTALSRNVQYDSGIPDSDQLKNTCPTMVVAETPIRDCSQETAEDSPERFTTVPWSVKRSSKYQTMSEAGRKEVGTSSGLQEPVVKDVRQATKQSDLNTVLKAMVKRKSGRPPKVNRGRPPKRNLDDSCEQVQDKDKSIDQSRAASASDTRRESSVSLKSPPANGHSTNDQSDTASSLTSQSQTRTIVKRKWTAANVSYPEASQGHTTMSGSFRNETKTLDGSQEAKQKMKSNDEPKSERTQSVIFLSLKKAKSAT